MIDSMFSRIFIVFFFTTTQELLLFSLTFSEGPSYANVTPPSKQHLCLIRHVTHAKLCELCAWGGAAKLDNKNGRKRLFRLSWVKQAKEHIMFKMLITKKCLLILG